MILRLNLKSDNVRNCEETTTFVKELKKIINCYKKGNSNLVYKQGLLLEKYKEPDKFTEMYMENGVSKTRKSVRKQSKTQSGNEFK